MCELIKNLVSYSNCRRLHGYQQHLLLLQLQLERVWVWKSNQGNHCLGEAQTRLSQNFKILRRQAGRKFCSSHSTSHNLKSDLPDHLCVQVVVVSFHLHPAGNKNGEEVFPFAAIREYLSNFGIGGKNGLF